MPDALILATADLHADIDTVLCADGAWSKIKGLSCEVELLEVQSPKGDSESGSRAGSTPPQPAP
jgi:hypothetical protein